MILFVVCLSLCISQHSFAEELAQPTYHEGKTLYTVDSGGYTYVRYERKGAESWVALPQTDVKIGDIIVVPDSPPMINFQSVALKMTFDKISFIPGLKVIDRDKKYFKTPEEEKAFYAKQPDVDSFLKKIVIDEEKTNRFHADISKLSPNWLSINNDPKFIEWAQSNKEPSSGSKWIDILNNAYKNGDADGVAKIVNYYNQFTNILLQANKLNDSNRSEYTLCLTKAEKQEQNGFINEALATLYSCIIKSNDNDRMLLFMKSNRLVRDHKLHKDGIDICTKLITKFPNWHEPLDSRASYYERLGKYNKAITDLNRAVAIKPDSLYLYAQRGVLFQHLKKYDLAGRDFDRACDMAKAEISHVNYGELEKSILDSGCSDGLEFKKAKNRGFNWVEFSNGDDKLFFYDKTKVKHPKKDLSSVWVRMESAEASPDFSEDYKPSGQHSLIQWDFNCSNETIKSSSSIDYNEDSTVKNSWSDAKAAFTSVVPNSISYALYKLVCKQPENKKDISRVKRNGPNSP